MSGTPTQLWQTFETVSRAVPSNIAIIYGETSLNYSDLRERCVILADSWRDRVKQNNKIRILISRANPLTTLISILAAWRLDASAAVLPPCGPQKSLGPYMGTLAPDLVVTDDGVTKIIAADSRSTRAPEECLILATSGSTVEPKLVALPTSSIALHAHVMARDLDVSNSDRFQAAGPLTHAYGLLGGPIAALQHGATVLLYSPPLVPSVTQHDIRKYAVTIVQGSASAHRLNLQFWNGKPFESVRLLTQAGEYFGPTLASGVAAAYPFARHVQIFGMTECGRISQRMITDPALASNEIGTPFSHIQWKIMPLDGDGAGDGGLFAVKGPSVMLGYVKAHGGYCGLDEDGYFRSADIVVPTPRGGLRHLGRYDRCFKTGGKLVNPSVVERFLMDQPGVAKAVCSPKAHEILGYVPTVKVVLENGAGNDVEDLKTLCMRALEPQMVPSEIAVVADLPQGVSGKILLGVSSSSTP